jgi:hypothetical protein
MINKKILALAIATAFSTNTFAIDMDLAAEAGVKVATEATGTVTDGLFALTNNTNALDFTVKAGFTIAATTKKFVRIDLTNAKFGAVPALTATNFLAPGVIQQGGADGDAFVIFEVTAHGTNPVLAADIITLATATYKVSATAASTATYALYENALDAINKTPNTTYKTESAPFTTPVSVSTGKFVTAAAVGTGKVTATSTSAFKSFKVEGNTIATVANLGLIDAANIVDGPSALSAAGVTVLATDVVSTTPQVIKYTGDFSVGTWSARLTNCAGAVQATTLNTAKTELTTIALNVHVPVNLCQTVDGKTVVAKNTYSAELVTTKLTNTVGSVIYDTTSIAVPFLTTYSGYNQRIYLKNVSTVAANYSITFASEADVTATAGTAATGTVPAKTVLAINASDIVTLVGKTRTTATIEVETADANISATTQIIGTGGTDTIVLN